MPNLLPRLNARLQTFIEAQRVFFVASAAADGRVNVSPKGMDTLRVLSPNRIVWLSLSGSGNETAAHIRESNRITLMFCALEGSALILRAYGSATVTHLADAGWEELAALFPTLAGARQIFDVSIEAVQTSCGTGVPEFAFQRERGIEELLPFYDAMSEDELRSYWSRKNTRSIDGRDTGIFR